MHQNNAVNSSAVLLWSLWTPRFDVSIPLLAVDPGLIEMIDILSAYAIKLSY